MTDKVSESVRADSARRIRAHHEKEQVRQAQQDGKFLRAVKSTNNMNIKDAINKIDEVTQRLQPVQRF